MMIATICLPLLTASSLIGDELPVEPLHESAHLRRPVAGALSRDGRMLFVANARSGTLSVIDTERLEVLREVNVGTTPSDLAIHPDGRHLLMTDEGRHELVVLRMDVGRISNPSSRSLESVGGTDWKSILRRVPVPRYPISISLDVSGRRVHVASLWSRRVSLFDVQTPGVSETPGVFNPEHDAFDVQAGPVVKLPFAPRLQIPLPDEPRLVVTDAFGGSLAVIDTQTGQIESVRELPAHNIRGLAFSADGSRLLVSHQIFNPLARASLDDIHWGNLLQNVVRSLSVAAVENPQADLLESSRLYRLGDVGEGAGDPAAVAADVSGRVIVALAGVGELAVFNPVAERRARIGVGANPAALIYEGDSNRVYVLNRLSDSVSVIDGETDHLVATIPLGPQPEPSARDRGERLFFDARQSHDGWLSCHSCHTDGHTSGQLADTLSDGTFGTPKRILSLLGTRDNTPWAWNGRFRELHEQVSSSFTSTLHGEGVSLSEASDVVAFLHSLPFPPPVNNGEWTDDERRQIELGRRLFDEVGCRRCHVPPLTYTSDGVFDIGMSDERGLSKFNPPSLRGLSQRSGFFHDKRAGTLEEVFRDHDHQLERALSEEELAQLIHFLNSL